MSGERYKHFWRCRSCGGRFSTIRATENPAGMNPRCPRKKCGGKSKPSYVADIPTDVSAGKAPGVIGANVQNVAYDRAMEITMQDHGMTDIQDSSRPGTIYRAGESTAPKLPMHLQKQADTFWGGQQKQQPKTRSAKVDLSPIYGQRAIDAGAPAAQFKADSGAVIEPILKHRPQGASAVPDHIVIAG